MTCSRDEASRNILAECRRLETAVGGLGSDHGQGDTLELERSPLPRWISTWLEATERNTRAGIGSDAETWVRAVHSVCTLLLDASVMTTMSSADAERIRLFVHSVTRGQIVPCAGFAARAACAGQADAGKGRLDALGSAAHGHRQELALYSELIRCLESIGVYSARYIADPRAAHSKGMNKLANTAWAAVYDVYQGQNDVLRDVRGMAGCMDRLMGIIVDCIAAMGGENSPEGQKATSKALKFLVSNYGRLLMLLGGAGEHPTSNTWEMIYPSMCSLWRCLVAHVALPADRDPFDGLALTFKALALSFGHAAEGVDPIPWQVLDEGKLSINGLQTVANVLITASGKMSRIALERMVLGVEHLMGQLAMASIQSQLTDALVADIEVGILEYLSRCVEADPIVFKRALYAVVAYLLRPHPLVEELLSRVMMGLMEWGMDELQFECLAMMSDMLNAAVSCDEDLGLSPGVGQGVNVLAAAMMASNESIVARVAEERFSLHAGEACSVSPSSKAPPDSGTVDVYGVARLAVFLRAMGYSSQSQTLAGGSQCHAWLRRQLHHVANMWRLRPVGDDSDLLLAWTAECLFNASKLVTLGPLTDRTMVNGTISKPTKGAEQDAQGAVDILMLATQRVAGRVVLSTSPTSVLLQRAAILLDAIHKNTLAPARVTIDGLDAALDAFDASLPTSGWLVGIAATRDQRPTSRMRRVYGRSLDNSASIPLQYLAMHSYKEYVSFSDSDEAYGVEAGGDQAVDVLPSSRIVGGSISSDFKARLVPYLVGLEYGDGSGEANVSANAKVASMLMLAAKTLENGFRQSGATKRVHRQVNGGCSVPRMLESLRSARDQIKIAVEALAHDATECSPEIREIASEMQSELARILKAASL